MSTCIRPNETPDSRCEAYESAEAVGSPSSAVVELGEDFVSRRMVGHHPEDDQESKEAKDMRKEDDAFGKRQVRSTPDVESDDEKRESEHQQSDLPLCRKGRIWLGDSNELLDDTCELNGA